MKLLLCLVVSIPLQSYFTGEETSKNVFVASALPKPAVCCVVFSFIATKLRICQKCEKMSKDLVYMYVVRRMDS